MITTNNDCQSFAMRLACRLSSMLPRGQTWLHVSIQVSARLLALMFSALSVFVQIFCYQGTRSSEKECDAILVAGIYALASAVIGNVWMFGLAVFTFVFALDLAPYGVTEKSEVLMINVYFLFSALVALWICFRQFCTTESEGRMQTPYVPVATNSASIEIV